MKSLTRRAVLPILFLGVGFAIGACEDGQLPTTSPTPPPAPPPTPPAEPEPEPPPVPTGLRVAATGDNFIEWTWNAVEGAGGYEVHFSLDENFDSGDEIIDRNPEQTSYRRQALPAGTRAFVRVRSHSGTGEDRVESNWSSHVTGMTARPVLPDAPANLRVTERGEGYLVWAWGVVAGVDGYRVQYSLDDEQFTDQDPTEELPATQHSYRVENLAADMDVYLRVRAYVGTGAERLSSGWSGAVTGRTSPAPSPVPTGLRVAATGNNFIEWTWNAVEGAGGYEVHFSLDENFDSGDEIIDRNPEQTSYRRQALPAGTRAFVRVRSHSGTGEDRVESNWSSHVTGMTARPVLPDAPANLRVTERGEGYLVWAWGVVAGVDGYRVQYSLDDEQFTDQDPTEELPATQHSYRVENLAADMDVYLRVRAYVGTGAERLSSGWSGAVTGRTSPAPSPITVSFVEESERVTEGETIEIQVAVSGDAGGPLRIQVAAEQDTVVDADYELLTPVLEIPPSGVSDRATAIRFAALEDDYFAEGDETLWLRLRTPEESDVEFGPRLAVTIDDAGVSPCDGIQVRAEPPSPVEDRYGVYRVQKTHLTLVSEARSAVVAADWIGPYDDWRWNDAAGSQNQFNVVVEEWSLHMEGFGFRQQITLIWNLAEEWSLRFRSADGACTGEPTLACNDDGCESRR